MRRAEAFLIESDGLLDRYRAEAREREKEGKRKGGFARHGKQHGDSTTSEQKGLATDKAAQDFGTTGGKVRNLSDDQMATFLVDSNGLLDRYRAEARERQRKGQERGREVQRLKSKGLVPRSITGNQRPPELAPRSTAGKLKSPEYTDRAAKDFGITGGKEERRAVRSLQNPPVKP